jgi:hypothetical protein
MKNSIFQHHRLRALALRVTSIPFGDIFWDLLLVLGCCFFAYGVYLAWRPAGFMAAGGLMVFAALVLAPNRLAKTEARR